MAVNDFINSDEAYREHEANTARTYLLYLRTQRRAFDAAWRSLDELSRTIVYKRMAAHGATADELKEIRGMS